MKNIRVGLVLVVAVLGLGGCIPILMHSQQQAESRQRVEWERQNF